MPALAACLATCCWPSRSTEISPSYLVRRRLPNPDLLAVVQPHGRTGLVREDRSNNAIRNSQPVRVRAVTSVNGHCLTRGRPKQDGAEIRRACYPAGTAFVTAAQKSATDGDQRFQPARDRIDLEES